MQTPSNNKDISIRLISTRVSVLARYRLAELCAREILGCDIVYIPTIYICRSMLYSIYCSGVMISPREE